MNSGLLRALLRAFAYLPFRWVQGVGAVLGWLTAYFPNEHLHITRRNLELAFPAMEPPARDALARRSLIEDGKTLTETIAIWLGPQARLQKLIREVIGEEALQAAAAQGKGVILCSPHLGSWELAGLYLGARYPMTTLYRPPRQRALEQAVRTARERTGARLVPTDASGVRALYQSLKEGRVVGILPDQDPRDPQNPFAPFFGVAANTMGLVSRLAAKTGAPVFFTFAERLPRGRGFRIHMRAAPAAIADRDPLRAATVLNGCVEACVTLAPAQYQWSYKRYRTRPAGAPSLY